MNKYVAFLRAINVGGHTVKMDHLRSLFEHMGFSNVETFIASGNVIFESDKTNKKTLEYEIQRVLRETLGYEVATFIRSIDELAEIAKCKPYKERVNDTPDGSVYIGFLPEPPKEEVKKKLISLQTEAEEFSFDGAELYWLCRIRFSESKFSGALLEKTLGTQTTLRKLTTVKKIAAK